MPEPTLVRNTTPPPAPPRSAAPPASPTPVAAAQNPVDANPAAPLASAGAILLINQTTLAIFQRNVPEKNFQLVLLLTPNGSVKLQGVALQPHQIEEIGKLPPQFMQQLEANLVWDRDLIVFHCYRYEDARRVPAMLGSPDGPPLTQTVPQEETRSVSGGAPAAAAQNAGAVAMTHPETPTNRPVRRGQRVHIKFGTNAWNAIYWGQDNQGTVVAHTTHGKWTLMHLDLARFEDSLEVEPQVDEALVQEIEQALLAEA